MKFKIAHIDRYFLSKCDLIVKYNRKNIKP